MDSEAVGDGDVVFVGAAEEGRGDALAVELGVDVVFESVVSELLVEQPARARALSTVSVSIFFIVFFLNRRGLERTDTKVELVHNLFTDLFCIGVDMGSLSAFACRIGSP